MDETTRDEIMRMHEADQAVRLLMIEAVRRTEGGVFALLESEAFRPLIAAGDRVDAENSAQVVAILDRVGWPTEAMVGSEAAGAWDHIVSQRVSAEALDHAVPCVRAAAERGEVSDATVAGVEDRADMLHGRPQRYGTQWTQEPDGTYVPRLMDDPVKVDERRARVGLRSLAEEGADLERMYGSPRG